MIHSLPKFPQVYLAQPAAEKRVNARSEQTRRDREPAIEAEWRPIYDMNAYGQRATVTNLPVAVVEAPGAPGSTSHLRAIARYQQSNHQSNTQQGQRISTKA